MTTGLDSTPQGWTQYYLLDGLVQRVNLCFLCRKITPSVSQINTSPQGGY